MIERLTAKKIFGLVLCLALVLALSSVGTQAKGKGCDCANIPIIFVPGFNGSPLYLNYGTPEQAEVPVGAGLQAQIIPMAKDLAVFAACRDWDRAADALAKLFYGLLGEWQVDERGESVKPITVRYSLDKAQDHRENRKYWFSYDWRMDPMENAAQLNAYIQEVKAATGHGKVALQHYSEGGVIAMTYLAQFGCGDVEHLILTMSGHDGLTLAGELCNGRVAIDGNALAEFLRNFGRNQTGGIEALISPTADLLQCSGLADFITAVMRNLLPHVRDRFLREALLPLLMHYPAVWSFVPDEHYDSAKKLYLGDPKYGDFVKMIDNQRAKAGPGKADQLLAAAAKRTKVSIVVGYGSAPIPLTANAAYDCDIAIDAARQSSGAVVADYGKALPSDYRQKIRDGHEHLSPGRRVDASACLLPEQTWFIEGMMHTDILLPALDEFVAFLADSKKQPTVRTSALYPQFMARLPDGSFAPA